MKTKFFVFLAAALMLSACSIIPAPGDVIQFTVPDVSINGTPLGDPATAEPTAEPTVVITSTVTVTDTQVLTSTPTAEPAVVITSTVTVTPSVATVVSTTVLNGTSTLELVFTADGALDYPMLDQPDPSRQLVFPDVAFGDRPPLVRYESPFEDGDYFEDGEGDVDVPQYYYRVMTAGEIRIDQLGVHCIATETKGCLVIVINHFGPTVTLRDAVVDNGFTVAGRVFDMGDTDGDHLTGMTAGEKVNLAGQALLDHYAGRMTASEDGANCSVIDACLEVEWHVIVVGNGELQSHWSGVYARPATAE